MGREARRTTLNLDEALLDEVRDTGVRNISRYVEGLIKRDLRGQEKVGKKEAKRIVGMLEKLDVIEQEWYRYLRKVEVRV